MELLFINRPTLDINISETIPNGYQCREKNLGFLSSLRSFLFQNYATYTAKVRKGHFWTIFDKFRVFLIIKGLVGKTFRHNLYLHVPLSNLKPLIHLFFKNISNCAYKCCFYTMNFEVTYFKIGFKNFISTISDIYLKIKYFFNQNI